MIDLSNTKLMLVALGIFFSMTACRGTSSQTVSTAVSSKKDNNNTHQKAIVSLTYDDGLQSQLVNAIPALNERGLLATFFVNDISTNLDPWKAVRAAGHELGSHTLFHPCTASFDWVQAGNASEDYDLKRMAKELDEQILLLQSIGQPEPISFAYPCGTTWVGKEQSSYIPLIEQRFESARGVSGDIVTALDSPMNVPAYFLEGPLEAFIGSANAAISDNGWVVFGFHGIGGDHLPVSNEDHIAFLDWLVAHQSQIEVLPFGEAARQMKK